MTETRIGIGVELPSDLPDAAVVPQAEPDRLLLERLGEPSSLPFAHEHPLAHSRAFFGVHETQARSYTPGTAKSFHINRITTQRTTPHVQRKVQGGSRGATHRKLGGFRTRQVFLRHTRQVAPLQIFHSWKENAAAIAVGSAAVVLVASPKDTGRRPTAGPMSGNGITSPGSTRANALLSTPHLANSSPGRLRLY